MKIFKSIHLLLLLLVAFFTACNDNNIAEENGNNGTSVDSVTFNLRTTRGALTSPVNDDELISSYMIVVAKANTIVKVLQRSSLTPAEMHPVKAQLTAGNYKVYAFANIPFTTSGDYLYGRFVEGETMPNLSTLYYNVENGMTGSIPMTNNINGLDITVIPSVVQSFDIEVVRMVAKLEFMFTNSSESNAEISAIKVSPLTKSGSSGSCVPLMWYNDNTALSLASDVTTEEYTHTLLPRISITAGTTEIRAANSTSFYIAESNPDALTKSFLLGFTVRHGSLIDEYRYALLDKSLGGSGTNLDGDNDNDVMIRRNDWLRIPIDLVDWQMRLEAYTYPPIGGYPEADIDEVAGNEFVVVFEGGGEFSIRPFIRKSGVTDWFGIDNKAMVYGSPTIDVDDPDGLFNTFPTLRPTGEIRGKMNVDPTKSSIITLSVEVITNDSPLVTKTLTRKIFVTQK